VTAAEQALHAAARALDAERGAVADHVERAAVHLALRVAEQALRAAVAADPDRVLDAVQGALRALVERERVHILVHPDDLPVVRGAIGGLMQDLGGVEHWEVQAERRVTRGGAVVRTAEGEVDASLEAKLERAREVLDDELSR
jgi:flagellar assembly protein FliH